MVKDLGRAATWQATNGPRRAPTPQAGSPRAGDRCYLSLRTALEAAWRADDIILLTEAGRPLTAADVVDVLGTDVVAEIPVDAAVARSIDAGLLWALATVLAAHGPATLSATRPDDVCALAGVAAAGAGPTPLVPNLTLAPAGADGAGGAADRVAVEDLGRLSDVVDAERPEKAPDAA